MSNQKKLLLFVGLGLILLVSLFWWVRPRTQTVYTTKNTLPNSAIGRWDDTSVTFSNDRSLVTYNLTTKASQVLSADAKLPALNTITVSADKRYVLFKALSPQFDDVLGAQLANEPPSLVTPIWWVYDVQLKQFSHLDSSVSVAQFDSGTTVKALASVPGAGKIQTYQLPSTKPASELAVKPYLSFSAIPGSADFYGLTAENTVEKVIGNSAKTIIKEAASFDLSADAAFGSSTAAKKAKNNQTNLVVTNLKKLKGTLVGQQQEGGSVWSPAGSTLVFSANSKIHKRDFTKGGKDITYTLKGLSQVKDFTPFAYLSENLFFTQTPDGTYLVAPRQTELPYLPSTYNKTLPDDTSIVLVPNDNAFVVTFFNGSSPEKRAAVYKQLRADSINPDLVTIRFSEVTLSGSHP
jgi:hypothetical protein